MQRALEGLGGVKRATVDLKTGVATVETAGDVRDDELVRAVEGRVVLHRLRGILSRAPFVGRRRG